MENTSLAPTIRMSPLKRGASIATLLLGAWVLIAGFVLAAKQVGLRNSIVVGLLLMAFSALRSRRNSNAAWSWANVVLGLWLLLGPQALAYTDSPLRWNDFAIGWATIVLSVLAATSHDRFIRREISNTEGGTIPEHRKVA